MFRLWARTFQNNHMLHDTVICDDREETRTHKVFDALQEVCMQFDLGKPIWLDSNINDFRRHAKTRFRQDSFVEEIDFDYLEIQVIEEKAASFLKPAPYSGVLEDPPVRHQGLDLLPRHLKYHIV